MRFISTSSIRLSALAALLAVVVPSVAQAQAALSKVAIANPVRVFNQIQKTKDLRSTMEARTNALEQQRLAKANEIRDMQAKRDLLNKSAPEYAALNRDIVEKTVNLQAWMQITKLDLERAQKEQILQLFEEITKAIAKVAEQKGIEIVLAEQKPEIPADLEAVNVEQLRGLLGQRNVLYTKALADISDAVIVQMDADYKSGGAK
jgi:Skp family chaperone for outer membrane proteins